MRVGVSSTGRWWVSMGPLGWLLYLAVVVPVLAAWWVLTGLARVIAWACRAVASRRRSATSSGASS
jgi:hypothetical protein